MGIRGHLITKYEGETFSLGDEEVMNIVEEEDSHLGNASIHIDESGCGMIMMSILVAKKISLSKKVDACIRKDFAKDIEWAKKNDGTWLKYYCY